MIWKIVLFSFSLFLLYLMSYDLPISKLSSSPWQFFSGRNESLSLDRPLIYRARVPSHWIRQDPLAAESIADTKKSICEFYIREEDQVIRITFHTFPILQEQPRIPPQAQIARWKKQFEELDVLTTLITSETQGGFNGFYFEGQGLIQGNDVLMMGWARQLATSYERLLAQEKNVLDHIKRADYTIKVTGSPDLMNKHRTDILAFSQSFELIDELPPPL